MLRNICIYRYIDGYKCYVTSVSVGTPAATSVVYQVFSDQLLVDVCEDVLTVWPGWYDLHTCCRMAYFSCFKKKKKKLLPNLKVFRKVFQTSITLLDGRNSEKLKISKARAQRPIRPF